MSKPIFGAVILCAAMTAAPARAVSLADMFGAIYLFGDSLTDSADSARPTRIALAEAPSNTLLSTSVLGAPYPPVPYFNGRFSDGPVYSDFLIAEFEAAGKIGLNFAFGGARAIQNVTAGFDIPDFADQRLAFEALGPLPADGLGVVLFGGNDLLSLAANFDGDLSATAAAARAAADEVGAQIAAFDPLVLDSFALINLVDIALSPRFALDAIPTALGPIDNPLYDLRDVASVATAAFNAQLAEVAADLRQSGRHIFEVDAGVLVGDIVANAEALGFIDGATPCGTFSGVDAFGLSRYDFGQDDAFGNGSGISPTGCVSPAFAATAGLPANNGMFLWHDDVHFTQAPQQALATLVRSAVVAPIPLPAPAAMLLAGLVLLGGLRRLRA